MINQAGQVAFQARLSGSSSGVANDFGLYFFDDQLGLTQIARVGDAFLGSTISSIFAFPAGGRGGSNFSYSKMTLNQEGRPIIAYGVGLADGRSVIALWELVPEPGSLAIAAVGAVAISAVAGWPMRKRSRS